MSEKSITCISRTEMVEKVREHINHILRENLYEMNLDTQQLERLEKQKKELRMYLKRAGTGDAAAKEFMVAVIQESIQKLYLQKETDIEKTYLFSKTGQGCVENQFAMLLFLWKKQYGKDALDAFFREHQLPVKNECGIADITEEQIREIYHKTQTVLTYQEKLELLSLNVYAYYKGLGVIDEIRDMNIDGVSGGVSGADGDYRNVWIFYKGRSIHLSFLDFRTEQEIERIARNICRYRQPGEISKARGYLVHEMADHARVVVARPDFAESWTFFIRKLDFIRKQRLEELYQEKGVEHVIGLLRWLVRGCQSIGITGMQGCGKTTLLLALMEEIPPEYTLRVLELAFELHLRESYPKRNIMTFRETSTIGGDEGLEVQKKTDGMVTIIGEVVLAKVAAWMIESGQSGSLFTLFTHHAKTTDGLVYSLRNSLLKEGNFRSEKIALSQVTQVVHFDVHLHMDRSGRRYIERISEIIPREETSKGFIVKTLVRLEGNQYVKCAALSKSAKEEIQRWLTTEEKGEFLGMDL